MSFWNRLFGGGEKQPPNMNRVFEKINNLINNDEVQNADTPEIIRGNMAAGGGVDTIPGAAGEFGRCLTNPIPVNGPLGELTWLSRLLTVSGAKVFFHRLGSIGTIDLFETVSEDGSMWDILYLDMYHTRKTKLAPSGYRTQTMTTLLRGVTVCVENFPRPFYDILCARTIERIGAPIADPDGIQISSLRRPPLHQRNLEACQAKIQGRIVIRDGERNESEKESYLLDRPIPTRQFLQDRAQAGIQLDWNFSQFEGKTNNEHDDFRWIKAELSYPSFDDLTFAYRNQIFSVLVERTDEAGSPLKRSRRIANLLRECRNNNLTPCIFPISARTSKPLRGMGWNLINAMTGEPVDPVAQSSDDLIKVSDWELNNWAVQIVSDYLRDRKMKLLSFCDAPGIFPQIWFEDTNGEKCWVEVIHAIYPDTGEDSPSSCRKPPMEIIVYKGFIARVSFVNMDPAGPPEKIYRSQGANIRFKGIEPLHTPGR